MKHLWNLLTPTLRGWLLAGIVALCVLFSAVGAWCGLTYQRLEDDVTIMALNLQISETNKTLAQQRELATFYYQANMALQMDLGNQWRTEKKNSEKR